MAILILIFLVGFAALIAQLGTNRKIGYGWSFAICLFAGPVIGLIVTLLSKKNETEFIEPPKQ
ncbi:MAG: hypothetical protein ACKOX3_09145 [Bacteroidota bacterium]